MSTAFVAFFDVDGTLTTSPTMFRFLRYYLAAVGRPPGEYDAHRQRLRAMDALGCTREEINRAYFTALTDAPAALLDELAGQWFAVELNTGRLYHLPVLNALRHHQGTGDHIVLVSGSYPALVRRIAADLGIDEVRCTRPEIARGHYTGRLAGPPMIGDAKALAVDDTVTRLGTERERTIAYGDHISDLPMLQAAGSGVVVGGDATLRAIARERLWPLLPGTPPAPPLPPAGRTDPYPHVPDDVPESA